MGKNKPRHEPDKPQNKMGDIAAIMKDLMVNIGVNVDGILENAKVIHIAV